MFCGEKKNGKFWTKKSLWKKMFFSLVFWYLCHNYFDNDTLQQLQKGDQKHSNSLYFMSLLARKYKRYLQKKV